MRWMDPHFTAGEEVLGSLVKGLWLQSEGVYTPILTARL